MRTCRGLINEEVRGGGANEVRNEIGKIREVFSYDN